jgi:hypothetical protein
VVSYHSDTIRSYGEIPLDHGRISSDGEVMHVREMMLVRGGNYVHVIFVLLT